uniref:Uncharacterized protein n=1 Tax=Moniliophthora roreri TaxID=221103 RepID=A0A0W0GDJ8_MONRR
MLKEYLPPPNLSIA